ncbi:hypothetical protein [Embleya sp. NPDC001921]
MRRIAHVLAACAAATVMTSATATSAHAAEGVLIINGTLHEDPSGCIGVGSQPQPLDVVNDTDRAVDVYSGANCTGARVLTLQPGVEDSAFGASVRVRS